MIHIIHLPQYSDPPVVGEPETLFITITEDQDKSISNFKLLVDRALNAWDSAPKELKDLGDMLTHGRITQDHTLVKIASSQRPDLFSVKEKEVIDTFIQENGIDAWKEYVNSNSIHKVLNPSAPQTSQIPSTTKSSE